jgi:class 3 adenylate cyclase
MGEEQDQSDASRAEQARSGDPFRSFHVFGPGSGNASGHTGVVNLSGIFPAGSGNLWTPLEIDVVSLQRYRSFEDENLARLNKVSQLEKEIREANLDVKKRDELIQEKVKEIGEIRTRQELDYLLRRVDDRAWTALLDRKKLQQEFEQPAQAFVISVDIRRSTELMLKALKPNLFAEFISELCNSFIGIIKSNYGVFDKFTGDGVLAFFPEFFSGPDAGVFVVLAAIQCHEAFRNIYRKHRTSFSAVLADAGLGIGIDYGMTNFLRMADGLTVVGQPVVYACRLNGAPAGHTYLNINAYDWLCRRASESFFFSEERVDLKHESAILAFGVRLKGTSPSAAPPDWVSKAAAPSSPDDTNTQVES